MTMARSFKPLFFASLLISLFLSCSAQCSSYSFSGNRVFEKCNSLPYLQANLHWTYSPSNGTVSLAYRATTSTSNWICWSINPTAPQMVGSQALIAYQYSNGTMRAYTSSIESKGTTMPESNLSFSVSDLRADYDGGEMIIFATVQLPDNKTNINQVWQEGPVSDGSPQAHPMSGNNLLSVGTLDFQSAVGTASGGSKSRLHRRNVHGVLAAVSWGVLMPIGAIIARYVKVFKVADPAWFYLHVACQISAYIIGVAAWGTGLKLGNDSPGIKYTTHRNIGITLFCFGTLQMFALLLRPQKNHKYRLYWNIYHHSIGYSTIVLSIINIFKGFDILDPEKKWKRAYIGIIIALGAIALALEAITWPIVIKRRTRGSDKSHHGVNGANGYGGRQHQEASA